MQVPSGFSRAKIRKILRSRPGSISAIARELDPPVSPQHVSIWLAGRTNSKRIEEAVTRKALEILEEEESQKAGAA